MASRSRMPVSNPDIRLRLAIRCALLLALLAAELTAIAFWFGAPTIYSPLQSANMAWPVWLFRFSPNLLREGMWIALIWIIFLVPRRTEMLGKLASTSTTHRWWPWLLFHGLMFGGFILVTQWVFGKPTDLDRLSPHWLTAWLGFGSGVLGTWLLALAPGKFWFYLARDERSMAGLLAGFVAVIVNGMLIRQEAPLAQKELWSSLSVPTLSLVRLLLGWIYPDVVYTPETAVVGTPSFRVEITYACSGIEGISLVTFFLAVYLWLFRRELQFPQVLWLFPIGIVASWISNVLRLTALVSIGSSISPEIAMRGFHENAGWAAFTVIAVAAMLVTHRMHVFSIADPASLATAAARKKSPAPALLVPFIVQMGALILTSLFTKDFDLLYPLRILAVAAALYYFRRSYYGLRYAWSWQPILMGIGVFLMWIALEPSNAVGSEVLAEELKSMPVWGAGLWLGFRVFGSIVIIPLAEEFAFRGYLLRKLVDEDFERVSFRRFSWFSFFVSSVAFGLLHGDRWLAGSLAGMGFASVVYRRGRLVDAMVAHMTANALISAWVLGFGNWQLWS